MKNKNIVLFEKNLEELDEMIEILKKDNSILVIRDLKSLMQSMVNPVDLILVDYSVLDEDGKECLQLMRKIHENLKIVTILSHFSEQDIETMLKLGVDYFSLRPVNLNQLFERCDEIIINKIDNKLDKKTDEKIGNLFIEVGIPANIRGYKFLREAVKLAMNEPNIVNNITKELYPNVAKTYDTSASRVERAIRHAIEVAWSKGKLENINNAFGVNVYSKYDKPTNGEFIALVADKMLFEA